MVETRSGRRFAVFFFVAAFLVLLLGRWLQPVNHVALSAAAPFQSAISAITNGVGDGISGLFQGPRLRDENDRLSKEISILLNENVKLQQRSHDYAILARMLKFWDANNSVGLLPSRVIGYDSNSLSPTILINKGSRDGLRQGMTVLDHHGYFIGSISDIWANAARVQLLLNPSSSVGALDLKTQARGLVEGQYDGMPKFDNVLVSQTVHVGDLVVTSGDYNLYPRTVLIGQVVAVRRRGFDQFQTAEVRPAADFANLEIVQVVRNFVPSHPFKVVAGP